METGAAVPVTGAGESEEHKSDPRFAAAKAAGNGERGREMLEHVSQGAELDAGEELSALDWLLGDAQPIEHTIPVDLETPQGMRELKFHAKRIDPRKIDGIEIRNVSPTGRVDRISADAEIVCECCDVLDDGKRKITIQSEEFRTLRVYDPADGEFKTQVVASSAIALEKRLRGQEGLITLVAAELRRLCGFDNQRLGTSQRRLVEASLG